MKNSRAQVTSHRVTLKEDYKELSYTKTIECEKLKRLVNTLASENKRLKTELEIARGNLG